MHAFLFSATVTVSYATTAMTLINHTSKLKEFDGPRAKPTKQDI